MYLIYKCLFSVCFSSFSQKEVCFFPAALYHSPLILWGLLSSGFLEFEIYTRYLPIYMLLGSEVGIGIEVIVEFVLSRELVSIPFL